MNDIVINNGYETEYRNGVFGMTLVHWKHVFNFRKCEGGGSNTSLNIHRVPGEVVNGSKFLGFQFLNTLS